MAVVQYEDHFPPLDGYLLFQASKWIECDWNKLCFPEIFTLAVTQSLLLLSWPHLQTTDHNYYQWLYTQYLRWKKNDKYWYLLFSSKIYFP